MTTVREIQDGFEKKMLSAYGGRRSPYEPTSHWASNIGHPCRYYLWARWKKWEEFPRPDDYLLGVFAQGRDGERLVIQDLMKAGYDVTEQEKSYRDDTVRVSGRIDLRLSSELIRRYVEENSDFSVPRYWGIPTEIKNVNSHSYDEMTGGFRFMFRSFRPWVRKYPMQALGYGKLIGEPFVAMIIRDKNSRQTHLLIERVSDYKTEIKQCRERLLYVNSCLDTGATPEPMDYDHIWCHRCDAWSLCPQSSTPRGKNLEILNDEMTERFRELNAIAEAAKPHVSAQTRARKEIREALEKMERLPANVGERVITAGTSLVIEATRNRRGVFVKINDKGGEDALSTEE